MKKILYCLGLVMAFILGTSYAMAEDAEPELSYVILDIDNADAVTVSVNYENYPVVTGENKIIVTIGEFNTITVKPVTPYGIEKILNVTDNDEIVLSSTSWDLYISNFYNNYEKTYKITTVNLDDSRTAAVSVIVDDASLISMTRGEGGRYEKLALENGNNVIKYNPEKQTVLTFSNYDRCYYSVTADGVEVESGSEESAYYQVYVNMDEDDEPLAEPVKVIDVKTQFPDVKYDVTFSYPGEVTENVLSAVYVDDEAVADFNGSSLKAQAGSVVSLELNPELTLDGLIVNGVEKEWYSDYEYYNFVLKGNTQISVAAHEKKSGTITVSTNNPDAIVIGVGDMWNPEILDFTSSESVEATVTEPNLSIIWALQDYSYMLTIYVNGEVVETMWDSLDVNIGDVIYFELTPYPTTLTVINVETQEETVLEAMYPGMYSGSVATSGIGLQFILKESDGNGNYLTPNATAEVYLEENEDFSGEYIYAESAEDAPYWDVYGFDGELVLYVGYGYNGIFIEKGDEYVPNNLVALDNNSGEVIGSYDRMGAILNITGLPAVFHFQDTPDYTATRYWGPVQEDNIFIESEDPEATYASTITRSSWPNNWIFDGFLGLVAAMVDFENGNIVFVPATPYDVQVAAATASECAYNAETKELTIKVSVPATAVLYNSEDEETVLEETYVPYGTVYTVAVCDGDTELAKADLKANDDFEFVGEVIVPNVNEGEFAYKLSTTGAYGAVHYVIADGAVAGVADGAEAGLTEITDDKGAAEIYTVTGIRVSGKNLPAGIYISKGQKVIVR